MSDAVENFLIYFTDRYPDVHLTAEVLDLLRPGEAEDFDFLAVSSNSVDIPEHFRLIETLKEEAWLLLPSDCWLRTGEAVSLAEIGCPLLGDGKDGRSRRPTGASALCACRIRRRRC